MSFLGYEEKTGTHGDDHISAAGYVIAYGLDGDDTFFAESYTEQNFLLGGRGDDVYRLETHGIMSIIDEGGQDRIDAPSIDLDSALTYIFTLEERYLWVYDSATRGQFFISDWESQEGRIEEYRVADGTLDFSRFRDEIHESPGYQGNLSSDEFADLVRSPVFDTDAIDSLVEGMRERSVERADEIKGLDDAYYLAHNPDLVAAGVDPVEHYANYGWKEGRAPNTWFDRDFYLDQNPSLRDSGAIPVEQYATSGWQEGQDPNPWFDVDWYLEHNRDIAAAGIEPVSHFVDHGWKEGRDPNPWFDVDWYLSQNPDIASAGIEPVEHYWDYGWQEGRQPSEAFDPGAYLAANPDVALAGVNPLEHWMLYGQDEGCLIG
ncbi:hypothetical protein [Modicisalibacter sp. MOD 31.J]|uniref:hypothetical protein n=1 Tax=Modicisalibacter sp. MOD 31.J TaxID=2831897 RepID=UPI001CCAB60E|nr:hypothetical protein [Modicisalibacter sp. MOD 31.J]MBZ9573727.1 hypothetical protein [Modicisalibacter sp. MOD 31.J]